MNIHCFVVYQGYDGIREARFSRIEKELYFFVDYEDGKKFCQDLILFRKQVFKFYSIIDKVISEERKNHDEIIKREYESKFVKVRKIDGLNSVEDEITNLKINHELKSKQMEFNLKLSELKTKKLNELNLESDVAATVLKMIDRKDMEEWMRYSDNFSIHHFESKLYHKNYLLE